MTRALEVQSTFSSGEVEPRLVERRDVQFYYSAVTRGRQVIALPQGGFAATSGTVLESPLRNPLTPLDLGGAALTAPNGGDVAHLTDGDPGTALVTNAATGGTFVVLHVDLGAATTFCALDARGFLAAGAGDLCFVAQWSADNAAWHELGRCDIETTARNRRFATPPAGAVTARYLRLALDDHAAAGAVSLGSIRLLAEGAFSGTLRTINFNFRAGQEYTLAATPLNIDVFHDGVWQAAIASDIDAAMLDEIDWAQRLDSLVVFHETLATPQFRRQGRHTEWNDEPYPFRNLPLYDFGGAYANGVDAMQRIQLFNLGGSESFDLTIEGQTTTAIEVDASNSETTAANIKAALEALPNVDPGLTVNVAWDTIFDVIFTGGDNAARPWLTMAGTALDENGAVVVRELVRGKAAGEAVMSPARGWPRTGVFYQQSLLLAGLESLPRHMLKSVTGSPDDFNTEIAAATGAMLFELDGGTANEIVKVVDGLALMAFTRDDIYHLSSDRLSKTEVPPFKPAQQQGIKRGVPVASIEGGLIYVEAGGHIVRETKYSEVLRNFQAQNISVLSAHLLNDPIDLAHRRAVRSQENDLVLIVNADGSLIQMTALRSENITGFTLRETQGRFRAVSVNSRQETRLAVARRTAGVERLWLERLDRDTVTDCAHVATGEDITSVTPGAAFEGEVLHVFCDRAYIGTRTVAGGQIAGLPAASRIEAGYAALADVIDMPVLKDEEAERPMARLKRAHTLHLSLFETDHVAVEVNGGPTYEVPLMEIGGMDVGEAIGDRLFTGTAHLEGFLGFTETAQVRVRQLRPGRLTVRSMRKELRV